MNRGVQTGNRGVRSEVKSEDRRDEDAPGEVRSTARSPDREDGGMRSEVRSDDRRDDEAPGEVRGRGEHGKQGVWNEARSEDRRDESPR